MSYPWLRTTGVEGPKCARSFPFRNWIKFLSLYLRSNNFNLNDSFYMNISWLKNWVRNEHWLKSIFIVNTKYKLFCFLHKKKTINMFLKELKKDRSTCSSIHEFSITMPPEDNLQQWRVTCVSRLDLSGLQTLSGITWSCGPVVTIFLNHPILDYHVK